MSEWIFLLERPPLTKKTHQQIALNKKTGRRFVMSAAGQASYQKFASQVLHLQALSQGLREPLASPVWVEAVFWLDADRATDLTNLEQMVGDCLQGAGIIANDALIHSWDGSRKGVSYPRPRTELTVRLYEGLPLKEGEPKSDGRRKA